MKQRRPRKSPGCLGLTLIELIAVLAIVFVLSTLILSNLAKSRTRAAPRTCVTNLKNLGLAFRVFSTDNNDHYPMKLSITNRGSNEVLQDASKVWFHFLALSNELVSPKILICPWDVSNRLIATSFATNVPAGTGQGQFVAFNSNSNISYFVGLDANEEKPHMLLGGDRHLTNGGSTPFGMSQAWVGSLGTNHTSDAGAGWDRHLHNGLGNIVFADGSVDQADSVRLRSILHTSSDPENRIAKPD